MKRVLAIVSMLTAGVLAMQSCKKEEPIIVPEKVSVTGVSVDPSSLTLTEGETATLKAAVKPDNADDKTISWKSSDDKVAAVTDGKVTAVAAGEATITVTTKDGNKTAECKVTVNAKVYPVESVSLDQTELELTEGDEASLVATIVPENASNKNVSWSTSNPDVATVADGKVTAVAAGEATITVTTEDGGKTAECAVTVNAMIYPVESVSLDKTEIALVKGGEFTLTATVNPENATNKNITWSTSNADVATVEDGKVTALKGGTATITVTTEDGGKTAECKVSVTVPVTGVNISSSSLSLFVDQSKQLSATVVPNDASNKNVSWSSSDKSVATVSNSGNVTGVKPGTATITVKTSDGNKTATCKVTVYDGVQLWAGGPYWATCNIGAGKPEEDGEYFSWGNVKGYTHDNEGHFVYKFDESNYSGTKGAGLSKNIPQNSTYDAARAECGGNWRIPTSEEFAILIDYHGNYNKTSVEWTTLNGVEGLRITGKGDYGSKSIFLPASGYGYNNDLITGQNEGEHRGYYWSSTYDPDYYIPSPVYMTFKDNFYVVSNWDAYLGMTIRPVSD